MASSTIEKPPIDITAKGIDDLNNATIGVYSAYNPANSPIEGWVIVLVIGMAPTYQVQLLFQYYTNVAYYRACDGGSWRAWKKITTS